jgi:protein involved in polysaccharide export with SLBB domain
VDDTGRVSYEMASCLHEVPRRAKISVCIISVVKAQYVVSLLSLQDRILPNFFRDLASCRISLFLLAMALFCVPSFAAQTEETTLSDYRIAVGDILEFDFLDDQEMPRQVTVGSGGRVQIPLLGPANVEGLTIDEALATVKSLFVESKLLVDPKVTLAIAAFRPVFILGDVRSPGAFPYQALMTVERAIGLAGGLVAEQSSGEDRIVLRARLGGDINRLETEIAREAVWAARLGAQLDRRKTIETSDLPAEAQPYLKKIYTDHFLIVENRILAAELLAYDSQASILSLNLSETRKQVELLDKLRLNQEKAISFTKDELNRASKLRKSGLNTAGDLANVQQQLNSDEGRMLQILADTGETQRQAAALQLQLASLQDNRNRDALIQLQERTSTLQSLYVTGVEQTTVCDLLHDPSAARFGKRRYLRHRYNDPTSRGRRHCLHFPA